MPTSEKVFVFVRRFFLTLLAIAGVLFVIVWGVQHYQPEGNALEFFTQYQWWIIGGGIIFSLLSSLERFILKRWQRMLHSSVLWLMGAGIFGVMIHELWDLDRYGIALFTAAGMVISLLLQLHKKWAQNLGSILIGILSLLFFFWILPSYPHQIDMQPWYTQASQLSLDNPSTGMQVYIKNGEFSMTYDAREVANYGLTLDLIQGDKIAFISPVTNTESKLIIQQGNGDIIALNPQSTISFASDSSSGTHITYENGSIMASHHHQKGEKEGILLAIDNLLIGAEYAHVSSLDNTARIALMGTGYLIQEEDKLSLSTGLYDPINNTLTKSDDTPDGLYDFSREEDTYNQHMETWIIENYGWIWTQVPELEQVMSYKMRLLAQFSIAYEEKYKNYQIYRYILGRQQHKPETLDPWVDYIIPEFQEQKNYRTSNDLTLGDSNIGNTRLLERVQNWFE